MLDTLAQLVAPLNTVLFTLGNDHVTWAELLGFVTGGACVWLTVRASIANFPVGIANSAFFLVLFCSARLWADAGLQVIYIGLGIVGWWQWRYGGTRRHRAGGRPGRRARSSPGAWRSWWWVPARCTCCCGACTTPRRCSTR